MAGVLTTGTFEYEANGQTYTFSGTAAIEANYNESKNIGTKDTSFTVAGTSYTGAQNTATGPFIQDSPLSSASGTVEFWKNLTNRSDLPYAVYGQTLLMKGSTTATNELKNNGMGNMAIGGLITEATADTSQYVLNGDNNSSSLTLVANEDAGMNMYIGANTEIKVGGTGQIIVSTDGSWVVNNGKTLTLTTGSDGSVVFNADTTVSGGGTLALNANTTIANGSTLTISDGLNIESGAITVESGSTLSLSGTVNINAEGVVTARDKAAGNGYGSVIYSANTADYIKGEGTTTGIEDVSWSLNGYAASYNDGTISYSGDSSIYYIYDAADADYSNARDLVVDVGAGDTYSLGATANTALDSLTIKSGTVTSEYGGGAQGFFKGDVIIEGGAKLTLAGTGNNSHDALGWGDIVTRSITLLGEEGKTATLELAYSSDKSTTLRTDINLQGNALVTGGKVNSFGGKITATGTNNEIASELQVRNGHPLTVEVSGAADTLTISGNIKSNSDGGSTLTKSGEGTLYITGDIDALGSTINGSSSTIISSGSIQNITLQNSTFRSTETMTLGGTVNLTNVTLDGTAEIASGATSYTAGTLQFTSGKNSSITIAQGATFANDGFTYTSQGTDNATINSNGEFQLQIYTGSVTIANATMEKTTESDKHIGIALDNVDLILNSGTGNKLYGDKEQNLNNLTINGGTLNIESAAKVANTTAIAESATLNLKNANATLGAVSGAGRVNSEVTTSVATAADFTGTLAATNGTTLTDSGTGSGFSVDVTQGNIVLSRAEAITLDSATIGNGYTLTIGSETDHDVTLTLSHLTVATGGGTLQANLDLNNTGTLALSGVLTLGGSVELGDGGIALSGSLLDGLTTNSSITLFQDVDGLLRNGLDFTEPVSASAIFSNEALKDTDSVIYTVSYENNNVLLNARLVPEPATATLSLLALAALCARRRRK